MGLNFEEHFKIVAEKDKEIDKLRAIIIALLVFIAVGGGFIVGMVLP